MEPQVPARTGEDGRGLDQGLASSRLPDGFRPVWVWTVHTVGDLSGLRAELRSQLAQGAEPQPDLGVIASGMVLVASELATNALRHGTPPTVVTLLREGDTYLLDVADHDVSSAPYIAGARAPGQGGFGLQIARRIAVDVGWYTSGATKHVWARFPAPERADAT